MEHITPFEELSKEAFEIQTYLEVTCSENPVEALERGRDISAYLARSAKMLVDAKHHLRTRMNDVIINQVIEIVGREKLSAKIQNGIVEGLCSENQMMVDWMERINRTCFHQLEYLRTAISYAKSEHNQNLTPK